MERRSAPRRGRFLTADRVRSASRRAVSQGLTAGVLRSAGAALHGPSAQAKAHAGPGRTRPAWPVSRGGQRPPGAALQAPAPSGRRFAVSSALRPPFFRLTGRVCARMEDMGLSAQRPCGGAERRERAATGVWRPFQCECLHILSPPRARKCTSACNGGQKSAKRAADPRFSDRGAGGFQRPALPCWNGGSLALPTSAPAERVESRRRTRRGVLADRQSRQTVRERFFAQRKDIPPHRCARMRIPAALDRRPGFPHPRGPRSRPPPLRGLKRAQQGASCRHAASVSGAEWRMRASAPAADAGTETGTKALGTAAVRAAVPSDRLPLFIGARRFFDAEAASGRAGTLPASRGPAGRSSLCVCGCQTLQFYAVPIRVKLKYFAGIQRAGNRDSTENARQASELALQMRNGLSGDIPRRRGRVPPFFRQPRRSGAAASAGASGPGGHRPRPEVSENGRHR